VFLAASFVFGQTQGNRDAEFQINSVIEKAGEKFKQGLIALNDNLRPQARDNFDKAIEVFLMSSLNVQRNPKLQNCYNQLIETIYSIEFPSNQKPPQIKTLSATCGWTINDQLANDITKLILSNQTGIVASDASNASITPQIGFTEEKFEASPLDELSKLELTQEEQTIETTPTNTVRVVKAKNGDTVSTLAAREKVSAVEVAKFNGLLLTTKLPAGREIKIPNDGGTVKRASLNASCNLTLKDAPVLRGLRLGMTPAEVSTVLGLTVKPEPKKTKISLRRNGEEYVEIYSFNKAEYEKNKREFELGEESFSYSSNGAISPKLEGIRHIYLTFYKKALDYVSIEYDGSHIKWESIREFITNISPKLKLPLSSWEINATSAYLSCTDFYMNADLFGGEIHFSLADRLTQNRIKADAKQRFIELDKKENTADYEKKKVFKP
jgi:LysM repeat protein